MKHTGPLAWLAGIVCAFCLMIAFLITSVEAVVYWTPGYFETEYETYQVPETVHMQMDDLLYVTEEMMAYLRGNRDDLHIDTVVDGQEREFFNEREIAHMEDVRELFIGALYRCSLSAGCLPCRCRSLHNLSDSIEGQPALRPAAGSLRGNGNLFHADSRSGSCYIHRLHEILCDFPQNLL